MPFVMWRHGGRHAELLHSVRSAGQVRQVRLAWLGASPSLTPALKAEVARKHPEVRVDWEQIAAALARHPQAPLPPGEERYQRLVSAVAEPVLWAWFQRRRRRRGATRYSATVAATELWPEFFAVLRQSPGLGDLLADPDALDREAARVLDVAEVNYARRQSAARAAERATSAPRPGAADLQAALAEARAGPPEGSRLWAREVLRLGPGEPLDAGYLRQRAEQLVRQGLATEPMIARAVAALLPKRDVPPG